MGRPIRRLWMFGVATYHRFFNVYIRVFFRWWKRKEREKQSPSMCRDASGNSYYKSEKKQRYPEYFIRHSGKHKLP